MLIILLTPPLLGLGAFIIFTKMPEWHRRLYFAGLSLLSLFIVRGIIAEAVQFFYQRPRPFAALDLEPIIGVSSASFPSTSLLIAFTLSISVWFFDHKWGKIFTGMAVLAALANIAGGLSWPTDVLASLILGIAVPVVLKPFIIPSGGNKKPSPVIDEGEESIGSEINILN